MYSEETVQLRELLYYGMDNIVLRYKGSFYQICAGTYPNSGKHEIFACAGDVNPHSGKKPSYWIEVFMHQSTSPDEDIEAFFQAKLFGGKNFWEVEQEIEWLDE